ncbi:MAG: phosphatidate cytidylyltransferase [SAR86 cluster bacterium]|jgi:phosphatidate cytidylyltransferase|nr:phosphatidate cytidylyltransferase [SAR86 cluster bacterium]
MDKTRFLSGITMAFVIVLSFLFLPLKILTPLISIVISLSAWEFFKLRFSSEISVVISLILFFSLIYLSFGTGFKLTIISAGLLVWLIFGSLILGFPHNKNILQNKYFWLISGLFIHIPFWTSIFLIANFQGTFLEHLGLGLSPRSTLVFMISLSALMDTLAYFGGKSFGRKKFLSNISPNKTLEGFLIALLGTPLLVMPFLAFFYEYDFIRLLIFVLLVSIFAALGDATASLFKRVAGVKDSSNLLPGHGGILDRIDSHLAAAPCFVILAYLMKST